MNSTAASTEADLNAWHDIAINVMNLSHDSISIEGDMDPGSMMSLGRIFDVFVRYILSFC